MWLSWTEIRVIKIYEFHSFLVSCERLRYWDFWIGGNFELVIAVNETIQ